ncbi:DUF1820 family protein [Zobellella iuensis]|uniref:DUF1820 family protein n=1 Tax=Zobellella iuensis TaxID=2803811 RepID=A0ABS1QNR7_9GAMM|nr:DUF1820 family protein [Zobellella iuensis]MBL1376157.1 DUF1820 family protein [Zobellella iuensis]
MKSAELLYRVQFVNAGKHYEIYVREATPIYTPKPGN